MRAQAGGATGQEERRSGAGLACGERNRDRRPLQRRHGLAGRRADERGAELCDNLVRVASSNARAMALDYNTPAFDEMTVGT